MDTDPKRERMDTREGKEEGTQEIKEEATPGTQEDQHLEVKTGMGEEGKSFQDQEAEENHGIEGIAKIEGADNQGEALIGRGGEANTLRKERGADQVILGREVETEMEITKEGEAEAIVKIEEASPEVLQDIAMEEEGPEKREEKAGLEVEAEGNPARTTAIGVAVSITRQHPAQSTKKGVMGNANSVNGSIDQVIAGPGERERKECRAIVPLYKQTL